MTNAKSEKKKKWNTNETKEKKTVSLAIKIIIVCYIWAEILPIRPMVVNTIFRMEMASSHVSTLPLV
jgi:flagellar biosynthesis component FlhA